MDVVRITELQPKTYVEQGDYIAIDNQNDGTKKVQFTNLLDNTLSQENKIAPANVVGQRFTNMSASVAQDIADVEADVNTLRAAVGSPLKASTVAQMTDKNKIYVYVGLESGYTNGNWYYWNGSAWTSGGVYNSVAVVTDPTLTLSGVPADAKATGDEVTNLKNDLTDSIVNTGSFDEVSIDLTKYSPINSALDTSTGKLLTASSRITTKGFIDISEFPFINITRTNGFRWNLCFYSEPNENSFITGLHSAWLAENHIVRRLGNYVRITAYDPNSSSVSPSAFGDFTVKGTNYRINNLDLEQFMKSSQMEDEVITDISDSFVSGATSSGSQIVSTKWQLSKDFIDVREYDNVDIYLSSQKKINVSLYDSNKTWLRTTPVRSATIYSVDLSDVSYIKISVGSIIETELFIISDLVVAVFRNVNAKHTDKYSIKLANTFSFYSMTRGVLAVAGSRISTMAFISLANVSALEVEPLNGYYVGIAFYSNNSESSYLWQATWANYKRSYDVSNYAYCRITLRRADGAAMTLTEGENLSVVAFSSAYNPTSLAYSGEKISIKPICNYSNILESLANVGDTQYDFASYMQQGADIYNKYVFMLRHHAKCSVLDLRDYSLTSEFPIEGIAEDSHCNSANFGNAFPAGNTDFPYLYVGRCSYYVDGTPVAELEECYVLNITTSGASLVQTIKFIDDNVDYSYLTWDWMVDNDRNRLVCIGFAEAYGTARRSFIFKEFELPDPTSGEVITLHDSDVIEQWRVEDHNLQAFQGGTVFGKYIFVPLSNSTNEGVAVYDKYDHRQISYIQLDRSQTDELQSASVYDGSLYVVAEGGRIDKIDF
jgi:hypothetical protein